MIFERLDFYHDLTPRDGAMNMAIDEALAHAAERPTLRVYRWAAPSVSFGYFGRHREVATRWPGRALVRRWTGGGEVPHGEDFTYTLAVPRAHPFCGTGVRESYRTLHQALAVLLPGAALAQAVVEAEAPACFARPVLADVLVAGKKVAGAAQRRGAFGLLHQGSVQGVAWPADLAGRLAAALAADVNHRDLSPALLDGAAEFAARKYGTLEWLERR
jgi:lipoate-protein ligase A